MKRARFPPRVLKKSCLVVLSLILFCAAAANADEFLKRGKLGIDLNYPGGGIRYFLADRYAVEARGQFEKETLTAGLRGYRYFGLQTGIYPYVGLEADYILFKDKAANVGGYAGQIFAGGEYFVWRNVSVQFDFGPAYIYLADNAYQFSVSGFEYVINFGINYYFRSGKESVVAKTGVVPASEIRPAGLKKTMQATVALAPKQIEAKNPNGEWKIEITDRYNRVVRTFTGVGVPPKTLDWDGLDERGRPVDDVSRARIGIKMRNAEGKPVDLSLPLTAVSAEARIKAVVGSVSDVGVTFSMPQRKFQCWQIAIRDGENQIAAWEGEGVPSVQITWSGVDESGRPLPLDKPRYEWQFIDEDGAVSTGERGLSQLEVVVEERKGGKVMRIIGIDAGGSGSDMTGEQWAALAKAAKLIARNPGMTLRIHSYTDAAESDEVGMEQAKNVAEGILSALTEHFQVKNERIVFSTHGVTEQPPVYPGYPGSERWRRVDLELVEGK